MAISIGGGIAIGPGITMGSTGGGGSSGVDNIIGYNEMPPPINGEDIQDPSATINSPTGFTINDDTLTGIAIRGMTASNQAWFASYGTGTKTVTWGPGSTVASSTINVATNNPGATGGQPQLVFFVQGQSGAATYNYPFTFS